AEDVERPRQFADLVLLLGIGDRDLAVALGQTFDQAGDPRKRTGDGPHQEYGEGDNGGDRQSEDDADAGELTAKGLIDIADIDAAAHHHVPGRVIHRGRDFPLVALVGRAAGKAVGDKAAAGL